MAPPVQTVRPEPPGDPTARWLAVPLLLAVAAYWRVLGGELVFDDLPQLAGNAALRDLPAALRDFLPALLSGRRPVTVLTFALNHALTGLQPWALHATNVAIHLVVTALAFAFARAMLRLAGAAHPTGLAVAAAGAFALHPLQSQAVSYLVQRAEALAAGAYLGTLLLLLEAERRGPGRRGAAAYLGALATFLVGLGAKATLVTLPLAWLLAAFAVPTAAARATLATWPRRLLLLAPFAALVAAFAQRTVGRMEGATDAGFSVPGLAPLQYFLTQWQVLLTYLRLLVWPAGQSVDWAFPTARSLADPAVVMSGLALLALLAAAASLLSFGRRWPDGDPDRAAARLAAFGVGWFFVVLSATSSVIPRQDVLVEHRLYLASLGVFLALAVGAERLLAHQDLPEPRRAVAAALLTGAVWLGLAAALHRRNAVWESGVALWGDAVAKAPHKARVRLGLGNALLARGDHEGAVAQYREALSWLKADAAVAEGPLQQNLGTALVRAGRPAEGLGPLRRATELMPGSVDAAVGLAVAALAAGDLDTAELEAARTLFLSPEHPLALRVLLLADAERDRRAKQGPDGDPAARPTP
jgi:Flp pilus assembly protein TadD